MTSVPDWIQAFCAIGTLFIAAIVWRQSNKIKTLTDVVKKLKKQNEIAQTKSFGFPYCFGA